MEDNVYQNKLPPKSWKCFLGAIQELCYAVNTYRAYQPVPLIVKNLGNQGGNVGHINVAFTGQFSADRTSQSVVTLQNH